MFPRLPGRGISRVLWRGQTEKPWVSQVKLILSTNTHSKTNYMVVLHPVLCKNCCIEAAWLWFQGLITAQESICRRGKCLPLTESAHLLSPFRLITESLQVERCFKYRLWTPDAAVYCRLFSKQKEAGILCMKNMHQFLIFLSLSMGNNKGWC